MSGQRYRMKIPTLAVFIQDGHGRAMKIPKDAEIEVLDALPEHDRLVDVSWDGKAVRMFTADIRERGEQLDVSEH